MSATTTTHSTISKTPTRDLRVILIAAGEASRWRSYLGLPKHLAPIHRVPLLARTVRQLSGLGVEDVIIAGPDDARYAIEPATLDIVNVCPDDGDADKFLSSMHRWADDRRTVVLCADVVFTDTAIATIVDYDEPEWRFFARPKGSQITGCKYGEVFGMSFWPEHHRHIGLKLGDLVEFRHEVLISRNGGWELYWHSLDVPVTRWWKPANHIPLDHMIVIDDGTDDIDRPEDYDRIHRLWNMYR